MRHLGLIALITVGLALASTGGARAASETFTCPAEARGQVSYAGSDTGWVATTQSSPLVGLSIETIAGQTSLVCHYRMFGGDYWIYRRPSATFPACHIADRPNQFQCVAR